MKLLLVRLARSSEATGLLLSLPILLSWWAIPAILKTPAYGLTAICAAAVLAGAAAGLLVRKIGSEEVNPSSRLAIKTVLWAVAVAAALLVLFVRLTTGSSPAAWRGLLISGTALIPAWFIGSLAAVFTVIVRPGSAQPVEIAEDARSPRWLKWAARGVSGAVIGLAFLCPWLPGRHTPVFSGQPFRYHVPDALKAAPPSAWRLETSRSLGRFDSNVPLRFSPDERFIAGVDAGSIVIRELDGDEVITLRGLPFLPAQITFNPTGHRVFITSREKPKRIAVADISDGRFLLPQPKNHAVPDGLASWWREKEVLFRSGSNSWQSLNLDTLLLDAASPSPEEQERFEHEVKPTLPRNERWSFIAADVATVAELPETTGTREWSVETAPFLALRDLNAFTTRAFPEIPLKPESDDALFGTSDGSKVLAFTAGSLTAFYFTDRPPPPLRFKLTMPHGPEEMPEKAKVQRALAMGDLSFTLYQPMINPLNGATVGPERLHPKAELRFSRWEGTTAEAWVVMDYQSFAPGDVIADIHLPGENLTLFQTKDPHRWWTLAEPLPDAADISKLPGRTVLEAKRSEAIEAEAKAAAAKAKAAQEKQVQPSITPSQTSPPAPAPASPAEEIRQFIAEHHRNASEGKIAEFVADYDSQVDYFNNGVVPRAFILKDETEYHQKYNFIREKIRQASVKVEATPGGAYEVSYRMENEWQKIDGTSGAGLFDVRLTVQRRGDAWRIVKHRATKLP